MSDRNHISGETLAKFDALENVQTVRRALASHDDLTVDSGGLLSVHTPLNEAAVQVEQALGPERAPSEAKERIQGARALFLRARHWTQDPARIWLLGLTCVIAAGLLTFLILVLTGSL